MRSLALLALAALLAAAAPAHATTTFYASSAAFNAAAGSGLTLQSFETPMATAASLMFPGVTISETGGSNAVAHSANAALVPATLADGAFFINYDDNNNSLLNFVFSSAIDAVAFNFAFDESQSWTISGGITAACSLAANTNGFFGAISDTPFTSFALSVSGGPNVGIDALRFGRAAPAVATAASSMPEPATWAAMLLGFAVIGGAMRRRQHAKIAFAC